MFPYSNIVTREELQNSSGRLKSGKSCEDTSDDEKNGESEKDDSAGISIE